MKVRERHANIDAEYAPMSASARRIGIVALSSVFAASGTRAQAVTISGRVTDDSGSAVPAVGVTLREMGLGAVTDADGRYSFVVPATRVAGQSAILSVHHLGFAPSSVAVKLSGTAMIRDFVIVPPIYRTTASELLELDAGVARAAGLPELRDGPHREGEREIRIRIFGSIILPADLYRFIDRRGRMSGEHILYATWRDSTSWMTEMDPLRRSLVHTCTHITTGMILTCRARFTHPPEWARMWKTLDSVDVWTIPDEASLNKRSLPAFDMPFVVAELWDGHSYRAWSFSGATDARGPEWDRVTVVSRLLQEIYSQSVR